jgi:hypothetical protein
MIDARFVPVEQWPQQKTAAYSRKVSPFRVSYAKTLDLLEKELAHLRAKDILIQAYFEHRDIRNDGWPRSSARPNEPGVIVTFTGKSGAMSFPCDRFKGWEDNLRAIALSLEALRQVDRYGVTRNNEQYRGFARLEAAKDTRINAIEFLSRVTGLNAREVQSDPQGAYRLAARKLHPDFGGSHADFVKLQEQYEALTGAAA